MVKTVVSESVDLLVYVDNLQELRFLLSGTRLAGSHFSYARIAHTLKIDTIYPTVCPSFKVIIAGVKDKNYIEGVRSELQAVCCHVEELAKERLPWLLAERLRLIGCNT